jgi:hypothetical protein
MINVKVCILELILPKITRPNLFVSDTFPNFHLNIFALDNFTSSYLGIFIKD